MKRKLVVVIVLLALLIPTFPQIFHKNKGVSKSIGSVSNGKLKNGYKVERKGANYKFFSLFDYYIIGRCYVHSDVYAILNDSYKNLEKVFPDYTFMVMECSKKKGGRPFPHRTHQNGTSIDFMTPLLKNEKQKTFYDHIGIWRYAMNFNTNGQFNLNKKVTIDFEKCAKHILELEKSAQKNGYRIKKVILETNLKDEIFATKYGTALKNSNIYFVRNLPPKINALHDDHYHIDFEKL